MGSETSKVTGGLSRIVWPTSSRSAQIAPHSACDCAIAASATSPCSIACSRAAAKRSASAAEPPPEHSISA